MWIQLGSLLMFLGVVLGAFGAHALRARLSDYYLEIYKTAVLYHFIHAIGLFLVAWLSQETASFKITLAGYFFMAGIMLFSGSLYFLSVTQIKWLGAITPVGGICFLLGWLLLMAR
jgi:uncharacterized membrane protein YgdD (TMEM256/DUF423 family)